MKSNFIEDLLQLTLDVRNGESLIFAIEIWWSFICLFMLAPADASLRASKLLESKKIKWLLESALLIYTFLIDESVLLIEVLLEADSIEFLFLAWL